MKGGEMELMKETVKTKRYRYTAVFTPAEEGGFVVTVPALPGCVTEGDTIEEARAMVRDAIEGYVESLREAGEEVPLEEPGTFAETVELNLPSSV
jgi:predicted RNase H-like HicB family nuclease